MKKPANLPSSRFSKLWNLKKLNKNVCEVDIHDPTIGGPYISDYTCNVQGKCSQILGFSWFWGPAYNVGKAKMLMLGAKPDVKDYKTFAITGDDHVTLTVCSDETTGTLLLTDDDANTIDQKLFRVN